MAAAASPAILAARRAALVSTNGTSGSIGTRERGDIDQILMTLKDTLSGGESKGGALPVLRKWDDWQTAFTDVVTVVRYLLDALETARAESTAQIARSNTADAKRASDELKATQEKLERATSDKAELTKDVARIATLAANNRSIAEDMKVKCEKKDTLASEHARKLDATIAELTAAKAMLQQLVEAKSTELARSRAEFATVKSMASPSAQDQVVLLNGQITQLNGELKEKSAQVATLNGKFDAANAETKRLTGEITRLISVNLEFHNQAKALRDTLSKSQMEAVNLRAALTDVQITSRVWEERAWWAARYAGERESELKHYFELMNSIPAPSLAAPSLAQPYDFKNEWSGPEELPMGPGSMRPSLALRVETFRSPLDVILDKCGATYAPYVMGFLAALSDPVWFTAIRAAMMEHPDYREYWVWDARWRREECSDVEMLFFKMASTNLDEKVGDALNQWVLMFSTVWVLYGSYMVAINGLPVDYALLANTNRAFLSELLLRLENAMLSATSTAAKLSELGSGAKYVASDIQWWKPTTASTSVDAGHIRQVTGNLYDPCRPPVMSLARLFTMPLLDFNEYTQILFR